MLLIGYFNTLDKVRYGVDFKKRPFYGFTPFYGDYKKVKITYSGKQKGKLLAQIEIIKFDDFPTGRIINIIGNYHKDNILNLILKDSQHKFIEEEINETDILFEEYDKEFITIDPEGSEDLDDGFNLSYPILDIIIACPVYYLSEEKLLNKYKNAVSSRYYNKVDHLWGEKINSKASLLSNNKTVLQILSYNLESKEYKISFKYGINKNQLSYNLVDEIIKNKNEKYNFIIEWYNKLKKYFRFENSHELIQEIMILGNKKLTEYFEENNLPILYRNFKINHVYDNLDINQNIIQKFNQKKSDSAIYTLEKNNHELMGGIYTHFTSPLRRLVDTIHQLILFSYKNNNIELINKIKLFLEENELKINDKFNSIKRFHKEYNLLIENSELNLDEIYDGIVFNIYKNKIDVYCEKLNRFIKMEFVNINLLFQYNINFDEDNNIWEIINKVEKSKSIYKLGQNVKFKIKNREILIPSRISATIIL